MLALSSPASAFTEPGFTESFRDFANCPADLEPTLEGCLHAYVTGGVIRIGPATVPISLPGDTLDLGWYGQNETACEAIDQREGAGEEGCVVYPTNGILGGPPQPVPGGLLGSVGGGELTDVRASLEWAQPIPPDTVFGIYDATYESTFATPVFSDAALKEGDAPGLRLSLRIHLSGPFLSPDCYIGAASEPVTLALTTGITAPPPPNTPITGSFPTPASNSTGEIVEIRGAVLVDDAFAVPSATGCGPLIDAAIDQKLGLPSPAGENTLVLDADSENVSVETLREAGWSEEWGEPAASQQPAAPEPEPPALPAEPQTAPAPADPPLQTPAPPPASPVLLATPPTPAAISKPEPPLCRKGFVKKKVKRKTVCVRKKAKASRHVSPHQSR